MQVDASCPYCGEAVDVWVDESAGAHQRYVEDCAVCCRPWDVVVQVDEDGGASVELHRLDG